MLRWLLVRPWFRLGAWVVGLVAASLGTIVVIGAFASRGMADLEAWHRDAPDGEFRAGDLQDSTTFEDYLAVEQRVFDQLPQYEVPSADRERYVAMCRYIPGGPGDPASFAHDWNRTTELEPAGEPLGGVLLLHGLTDSPYSVRSIAELFQSNGYYALCLRLPGHGTAPAALRETHWEDWAAAARLGVRRVSDRIGPDRPLLVVGYSMGGALALRLAMRAVRFGEERVPDHLYLCSASIGVTAFARLSLVDQALAFIPYFEKSAWLTISPEFDPFKYSSFCKRAGYEVWKLTRANTRAWEQMAAAGDVSRFPPVLAFQSAVDATVLTSAVRSFFEVMPANGSELVVFDVRHGRGLEQYYRRDPQQLTGLLSAPGPLRFGVSVVTNPGELPAVVVRHRSAGSNTVVDTALDAPWPQSVLSLSHVAIPFPASDPLYGDGSGATDPDRLVIGAIVARGERNVLSISTDELMRMRYNPFFGYLEQRIAESLPASQAPDEPAP